MSETLEQRALRIWQEVQTECCETEPLYLKFARRLTEQGEPVAWMWNSGDLCSLAEREQLDNYEKTLMRPLYASPPSDALDGMVKVPKEPTVSMFNACAEIGLLPSTVKRVYAAILSAAMEKSHE